MFHPKFPTKICIHNNFRYIKDPELKIIKDPELKIGNPTQSSKSVLMLENRIFCCKCSFYRYLLELLLYISIFITKLRQPYREINQKRRNF